MFDIVTYWARRNTGKRGQTDTLPAPKPALDKTGNTLEGPGQMIQGVIHAFNRKYFRQKAKNRLMTKKGYSKGSKMNKERK